MNLFSNLLGKRVSNDDEVPFDKLSDEEKAEVLATEKAERIQFHREHVRNGPRKRGYVTAGQQRRFQERRKRTEVRKTNQRHRANFKTNQLDRAILRGQLQAIGALPYVTDFTPTPDAVTKAGVWLVANFAPRNEESEINFNDDTLKDSVENAMSVLQTGHPVGAKA